MGAEPSRRTTAGTAGVVLVGLAVLQAAGGSVPSPPLDTVGLSAALRDDPVLLALSVIRVVVVIAGWYTLGLAGLAAVARVIQLSWLARGASLLSPRFSRRLAEVLTTAVLLGGPLSTSASADSETAATDLPVMRWLPPVGDATTSTTGPTAAAVPAATVPAPAPAKPVDAGVHATVRVVSPGDHFWHLAETTMAARLGRQPTAREIAPYWRRLVDTNRDRLVHRGNPNLIFAGQEMAIPPGN